jgi:hypothetical protein
MAAYPDPDIGVSGADGCLTLVLKRRSQFPPATFVTVGGAESPCKTGLHGGIGRLALAIIGGDVRIRVCGPDATVMRWDSRYGPPEGVITSRSRSPPCSSSTSSPAIGNHNRTTAAAIRTSRLRSFGRAQRAEREQVQRHRIKILAPWPLPHSVGPRRLKPC